MGTTNQKEQTVAVALITISLPENESIVIGSEHICGVGE